GVRGPDAARTRGSRHQWPGDRDLRWTVRGVRSMAKTIVNPAALARAHGYSHGLLFEGAQRLLFVAGQIGWDARGQLVSADLTAQFRRALENVLTVVREAGGGPPRLAPPAHHPADTEHH